MTKVSKTKTTQNAPLTMHEFRAELAALIDRALAGRVHPLAAAEVLEDSIEATRMKWAVSAPRV
jgi:hypothetical protein